MLRKLYNGYKIICSIVMKKLLITLKSIGFHAHFHQEQITRMYLS
jgi:hypothetical protein